jgi:DNA mismatch repair protein MutS
MFMDSATLHDLEVFSTSAACGPTLVSLVDRTRTRAGRKHLCRRLVAPAAHSAEEILALQRAHQALAAEAVTYRTIVDRADADGAERYLSSNWQLPHGRSSLERFVLGVWRPAWYRQYLWEIGNGQARVVALLRAATDLRQHLSVAAATVLQDIGATIASHLDRPDAQELLRLGARQSTSAQLAFDQLARGCAKPMLTAVLDCVGTVEAMWSLAVSTVDHGWSYPRPASRLSVAGLFHPFLDRHGVPNDLHLDDRARVCFVTGPNMAGKSTFLKAVAVSMLLAHAGCGVPAESMEFPITGTVFSSVQIVDNLSAGESFYLAEVRRIRSLALALHDHGSAVAVVDEPFRGTNVHDAAEATLAVITRLAAHPAALVFVASHLAEVVPAILDDPRICLFHFAADVTGERPRFDYHLRQGMSTQRLGMTLLRQEQVLDLLERSAGSSHVPSATPLPPSAAGAHQGARG